RDLITTFDRTTAALADQESSLRAAVAELPRTERAAMPALAALNAAFPDVRRLARGARPGVRSTGPAARAMLPLVRELRGLARPAELRGLAADLRTATPGLTQASTASVPLLEELRAMSSCATQVLIPFGDSKVGDAAFPATGPVRQEFPKSVVGLAGESRSFDANGQWFKVLGSGGPETFELGNGLFGTSATTFNGVNPPPVRKRPPLEPGTPCETQEPPDLESKAAAPPQPRKADLSAPAVKDRIAKAQAVATDLMNRSLKHQGSDLRVADRPATLADVKAISRKLGLEDQLNELRAKQRDGGTP
ncbi:MAG: hypothetical protein HZB46_03880, partial [Solirubrobacterales bacterium]|nr:hypothetical protein [Solirubrobacterales bacterium]